MQTVADLKDSVSGLLSGTNLDNVTGLDKAIERAVRTVLQQADVPDVIEKQAYTLYDGITDYLAPTNIFGGALLDFRPQGNNRTTMDYVYKKYIAEWDRSKNILPNGYSITFEYEKGTGIARIASPNTQPKIILDTCDDVTGWAVGGDASSLLQDKTVFYEEPSAIRFNLNASGAQGTLTKTIQSQDLTDYEGVGVVFLAVRLPSATAITSIGVKLGNDASNYFDVSNTTGFLGAWKVGEWTIIKLDLSLATETGSVTITAVDYLNIYVNYDGTALTNVYLGACFISLPAHHEMLFYSSAVFLNDTTNVLAKTIGDDNNYIVFNDSAFTLLELETALTILLQNGGSIAEGLGQTYHSKLHGSGNDLGLYALYRSDNPSQEIKTVGNWYLD